MKKIAISIIAKSTKILLGGILLLSALNVDPVRAAATDQNNYEQQELGAYAKSISSKEAYEGQIAESIANGTLSDYVFIPGTFKEYGKFIFDTSNPIEAGIVKDDMLYIDYLDLIDKPYEDELAIRTALEELRRYGFIDEEEAEETDERLRDPEYDYSDRGTVPNDEGPEMMGEMQSPRGILVWRGRGGGLYNPSGSGSATDHGDIYGTGGAAGPMDVQSILDAVGDGRSYPGDDGSGWRDFSGSGSGESLTGDEPPCFTIQGIYSFDEILADQNWGYFVVGTIGYVFDRNNNEILYEVRVKHMGFDVDGDGNDSESDASDNEFRFYKIDFIMSTDSNNTSLDNDSDDPTSISSLFTNSRAYILKAWTRARGMKMRISSIIPIPRPGDPYPNGGDRGGVENQPPAITLPDPDNGPSGTTVE